MKVGFGLWVALLIMFAVLLHMLIEAGLPDLQWWARYLIVAVVLFGAAELIDRLWPRKRDKEICDDN